MSDQLGEIERLQLLVAQIEAREHEAKAQASQAKAQASQAKAREDKAKARADEAKARADEAKAEANEAKAEANEAKAKANEAKAEATEAKARADKERREKEEELRKNQKTTFEEYLRNCHLFLYKNLVLADKSKSSTGFATRVDGRYYPKWLRPWRTFPDYHRRHFEEIKSFYGERRLFNQESSTRDLGNKINRHPAGNENAIDRFEKDAVEDPVWDILAPIWADASLREKYQSEGLRFDNNTHSLTQSSDIGMVDPSHERQERLRRVRAGRQTPSELAAIKRPLLKPDGYGVRAHPSGTESFAFVYDYKAAHKFEVGYLKAAVAKERLFMEVTQVVNRDKYKTDPVIQEQEREEARIAMALTQVFHYMISFGVAYGYVAAGRSLVLLHTDRANLHTLYYHLCVPDEEVAETSSGDSQVSYTAVAQLASFSLLSLRSESLRGEALDVVLREAEKELEVWGTPYDDAAQLPEDETENSVSATSSGETSGSEFVSKAGSTTRKYPMRSRSSCKVPAVLHSEDDEEFGRDADVPQTQSRTKEVARKQGQSGGSRKDGGAGTRESAPTRQYCTQACLLGLKRGRDLDWHCPNALAHHAAEGDGRHPIDAHQFTRLVGEQLRQSPYRHCEAQDIWGKVGATGLLFKLELVPYGYTLVGKGTLSGHGHRLEHESCVYSRLDGLQGLVVPVYLGIVQLTKGYVLPGGARVVHMMLMSWAGEEVPDIGAADLKAEIRRSSQAVWSEGVDHGDERGANLLWNDERGCVMVIDFDRAALRPVPKHKQVVEIAGKRKRRGNSKGLGRKRGFSQGCL